ncbi:MAG: ABC transporter permease, partial [Desulfobacterales bacterium]|nr:ABC transporter permease [Desulfobacterales bacterium]
MPAFGEMRLQKSAEDTLTVVMAGSWKLGEELPSADEVRNKLESTPGVGNIAFDTRELTDWDSGLLIFLKQLSEFSAQKKITIEESGLPQGARKLLALAAAVPAKKDARKAEGKVPFLSHVGSETVDFFRSAGEMLAFIGDTVIAFLNLLRGKAQYRKSDLWLIVESCGGQALPIVSLICFLVGLILAFIGAIQLQLFGAQIYVADLVGIAMVRLMAAIMTGIVMAGRTG